MPESQWPFRIEDVCRYCQGGLNQYGNCAAKCDWPREPRYGPAFSVKNGPSSIPKCDEVAEAEMWFLLRHPDMEAFKEWYHRR